MIRSASQRSRCLIHDFYIGDERYPRGRAKTSAGAAAPTVERSDRVATELV